MSTENKNIIICCFVVFMALAIPLISHYIVMNGPVKIANEQNKIESPSFTIKVGEVYMISKSIDGALYDPPSDGGGNLNPIPSLTRVVIKERVKGTLNYKGWVTIKPEGKPLKLNHEIEISLFEIYSEEYGILNPFYKGEE